VWKLLGKRPREWPRRRWEDNIKMDSRHVGYVVERSGSKSCLFAGFAIGYIEPSHSTIVFVILYFTPAQFWR
jgi:hypothetical protein